MKKDSWTEKEDAELKRLLSKYKSLSKADPTHDIQFVSNLLEGHEGELTISQAISKAEIKRDFGAGKSGNVFVEYASRGKSSGLHTSEADWWIFLLDGDGFNGEVFVGIKKNRLKEIEESIGWSVNGGDNNTSKGKLVRLTKLIKPTSETNRKERTGVE